MDYMQTDIMPAYDVITKSGSAVNWYAGECESVFEKTEHTLRDLFLKFGVCTEEVERVIRKYPAKINPYYLSLIKEKGDGIWNQCIPDIREVTENEGVEDPLHEKIDSPVPGLVHRYPDRVLLLASNDCAMYCRFCTRKRRSGNEYDVITDENFQEALMYIEAHKKVRDVIISGGDPLMLSTARLEYFIQKLKAIENIEIIRIGTRMPCVYPMRIDEKLCNMLKKYHPLYINVHFNHPVEITAESAKACEKLADAGIPLGNQSVLLKGVNDDPETMKELSLKLLKIRVKPYYIYMPDIVRGTYHFRTSIDLGLKIIDGIRGWTSGMAVPHLVIDIKGGGGKIPLLPEYLVSREGKKYIFRNYKGKIFDYTDT